jgi:hypothetical protein
VCSCASAIAASACTDNSLPMYHSGICCLSASQSMWKMRAPARGLLTAPIHGTSLSMTSTTSACASASFWRRSFHCTPW